MNSRATPNSNRCSDNAGNFGKIAYWASWVFPSSWSTIAMSTLVLMLIWRVCSSVGTRLRKRWITNLTKIGHIVDTSHSSGNVSVLDEKSNPQLRPQREVLPRTQMTPRWFLLLTFVAPLTSTSKELQLFPCI
ncbi:unnamed protein product [Rhizoctonia solani]|uniref:Uncharacterized protein n=1 Tax=Rhizoctonia solani TaxID=456999 RepID=A0A8H3HAI0_9AGAM|nr:unnamed protein product [Rhizoctonia solani]